MTDLIDIEWSRSHDGIQVITLGSPRNGNALGSQLLDELLQALAEARNEPRLRGILLKSSSRVFSSGADLSAARERDMEEVTESLLALLRGIVAFPVPVVARVDGPVRAGGLGILAACDIVVAADSATFAFTEARLGLAPATISTTVLPVMTPRVASFAFLTAKPFDGKTAEACGLITLAVAEAELDDVVEDVLRHLASCEKQGLRATKALLASGTLQRIDVLGHRLAASASELFRSPVAQRRIAEVMGVSRSATMTGRDGA
jgi:enoyl-CoA hydratase/methylglutaconyl-CoA hydratase